MAETKRELIRRLPKYISLAHGVYSSHTYFTVPENTVYIFISKASRYLLQSVITDKFYKFFGNDKRNYTAKETNNMPGVMKGWHMRVYGPGQRMGDIELHYEDDDWPGMGIHRLPIKPNQFKETEGYSHGETIMLSSLKIQGVIFLVNCRATTDQSKMYSNQLNEYKFPESSLESYLLLQNIVSSSLNKRRRLNSPSTLEKLTNRLRTLSIQPNSRRRRLTPQTTRTAKRRRLTPQTTRTAKRKRLNSPTTSTAKRRRLTPLEELTKRLRTLSIS